MHYQKEIVKKLLNTGNHQKISNFTIIAKRKCTNRMSQEIKENFKEANIL